MGAATARWLARSGAHVVVFEQFEPGHARGSSHGPSRIFRFSYPDPSYVTMAQEAQGLWRELELEVKEDLLVATGGLDAGDGIEQNAEALEACEARFELIDGAEAGRRWAGLRLPSDEPVLWQPDGGYVRADRTVAALLDLAGVSGAEVRSGSKVTALEPSPSGVSVRAGEESLRVDACVVTAGGWAKGLLAPVGIELDVRPTRETVAYFSSDSPPLPPLVEWGPRPLYSLPDPGRGIKVGEHVAGATTDPDYEGAVDQESIGRMSAWVASRHPHAQPQARHSETCIYTNTPDEHFVLERHGSVVVGSPCSGHGFKFAPLIGKRLAELALG